MEIEKVKDIIDVNLIDKGLVKVTYSDSTSETIETQPLINTVNKVRGEVLEIDKRLLLVLTTSMLGRVAKAPR